MAETKRPTERLPIKLILPRQGTERRTPAGGSTKQFREVDAEFRASVGRQIDAVRAVVEEHARRTGGVPVRVRLLAKASAKSHRPEMLFREETCPIIGVGGLGELFVRATADGLARLRSSVQSNTRQRISSELSTVERIEVLAPQDRRAGLSPVEILKRSPRRERGFTTRVRLFDFGPGHGQEKLVADFTSRCATAGIRLRREGYSEASQVYAAECEDAAAVEALSRIVGVRAVAPMPLLRAIRPQSAATGPLPRKLPARGDIEGDFPVVAVVDTGVTEEVPALNGWVVGRESVVAPAYRNPAHGTFVAGLICWGAELNPTLKWIDPHPCAVFDLQVLPNSDPAHGDTEGLTEQEFLQTLEEALKQHANQIRVWNLSLSTDEVCALDKFSPFAEELDRLQERYNVTFVVSAGNFQVPPLLDYPRKGDQETKGRITAPADSVLGVTVGAVSHLTHRKRGPKEHEPSAFSRHGAGPNHIIKPDLVHYGGSCTVDASERVGVRSVVGRGIGEDLGTSFATPLVARTLAQVFHQITPTPSPVLARALLTHHARDPRSGGRVPDGEENYLGFGMPAPVPLCLECTASSSTLVFEDTLRPGFHLEWDDFPFPESLSRGGRYRGEIWMTVAFAPARSGRWGSEYCETHIDAHFGVYVEKVDKNTGEVLNPEFKGLVPPEHKNPGRLYESYQVEKLRKWAPVRTYHGLLGPKGKKGLRWRLMVRLLTRHGIEEQETFRPQPFALIVTIADPEGKAPVYDEMARVIRTRFQAENLSIRAAARVRAGT